MICKLLDISNYAYIFYMISKDPESLNYNILQDSIPDADDQIEKYTGIVSWEYLEKHFLNGSVIFVDEKLDIKEAGKAITDDNKEKVSKWLASGDILKPGKLHAEHWKKSRTTFVALVISPFVLVKESAKKES
ncbi:MAG: hypothetical protein CBC36_06540 [Verrucomicrobiaceae bacterium TMED76]|nr:MAG: hypothetical protein CBC36_06540 [Verrucomicrobiaceae bacterium TMED76]